MPERAPWSVDAYETEQERDDIPVKTLERVRGYQREVVHRKRTGRQEER